MESTRPGVSFQDATEKEGGGGGRQGSAPVTIMCGRFTAGNAQNANTAALQIKTASRGGGSLWCKVEKGI